MTGVTKQCISAAKVIDYFSSIPILLYNCKGQRGPQ